MLRVIKMPASSPPAISPTQVPYIGGYADALEAIGLASGYVREDGDLDFNEDHRAATTYLRDKFGVDEFYFCGTFGVLLCNNDTAIREGRRPILVGGFSALWREETDAQFPPTIGDPAYGDQLEIEPDG